MPFYQFFGWEGSPIKIDKTNNKVGTLILTSLLEDLVFELGGTGDSDHLRPLPILTLRPAVVVLGGAKTKGYRDLGLPLPICSPGKAPLCFVSFFFCGGQKPGGCHPWREKSMENTHTYIYIYIYYIILNEVTININMFFFK